MRYVVAASTERIVQACREALRGLPGVEFRLGSVPEAGVGCDAAILSFPLAHERYGGTPRVGLAQVLVNTRGDGAPGVILATPPRPNLADASSDLEVEEHVVYVLGSCVAEFLNSFPECEEVSSILIHLEAAGIDRRDLSAPLKGVYRFLSQGSADLSK
jgi:hypothetical protein